MSRSGAHMLLTIAIPLAAFLVSSWLTGVMRRLAIARGIVDRPNHRSAHVEPTARGGGVAIVLSVLAALTAASISGLVDWRATIAVAGGGLLVAAVGWIDDVRGARVGVRLGVHVLAAGWAVAWLGPVTEINLGTHVTSIGSAGIVLTVVAVVWAVNLYNFMDGLDGFAGTEGLTGGVIGGILLYAAGAGSLGAVALILGAACAGFLRWNWPPAKIFMGDVGSGFLGYCFAALMLASDRAGAVPIVVWLIVFGAFFFDATVTLLRRLLRRESVHTAHREHAYQRATERPRTHRQVTVGLLLINVTLGAIAWWAMTYPAMRVWAFALSLVVLTTVYALIGREAVAKPPLGDQPRA